MADPLSQLLEARQRGSKPCLEGPLLAPRVSAGPLAPSIEANPQRADPLSQPQGKRTGAQAVSLPLQEDSVAVGDVAAVLGKRPTLEASCDRQLGAAQPHAHPLRRRAHSTPTDGDRPAAGGGTSSSSTAQVRPRAASATQPLATPPQKSKAAFDSGELLGYHAPPRRTGGNESSEGQRGGASDRGTQARLDDVMRLTAVTEDNDSDVLRGPGGEVLTLNDFLEVWQTDADLAEGSVLSGLRTAGEHQERWSVHLFRASSLDPVALGPFESGRRFEVIRAWLADAAADSANRHIDVTDAVRRLWSPSKGLQPGAVADIIAEDGCRLVCPEYSEVALRTATLYIQYRLGSVRPWDISHTKHCRGVDRVSRFLPIAAKALFNVVGATLAASGYAVGKAEMAMKTGKGAEDGSVANSEAFRFGFSTWLRLNGVVPKVEYEACGIAGVQLRRSHFPLESPVCPAPPQDMKQTPIIVANHISYLDGLILATVFGAPKALAKVGTLNVPVLGFFAKEIGVIEVDRDSHSSRTATIEAINSHTRSWKPGSRPLLLFPEGTTTNGTELLEFKKGAFVPGAPVRPVLIQYTGSWHPATTNFKLSNKGTVEPTSDAEWCEQFLGHFVHSLRIRVLPPYVPNEDERSDSRLYAANVRNVMVKAYAQMQATQVRA